MAALQLGYDVTIADVVHTLENPQEYVRRVLANFYECGVDRDRGRVRMGVCGEGIRPDYKFDAPDISDRVLTFSGTSHKQVSISIPRMLYETWSDGLMSLDEVAALLGSLRNAQLS